MELEEYEQWMADVLAIWNRRNDRETEVIAGHYKNDVPVLLAEIKRLREADEINGEALANYQAEVARLRAEVEKLRIAKIISALVERVRGGAVCWLPDPIRLEILADWLDKFDIGRGVGLTQNEVQCDLRKWAKAIKEAR